MNSATQTTGTANGMTDAEDLICMGLEVEQDLAADEAIPGREAAIKHLRRAIEEVGVSEVLALLRTAAQGASEMHVGDAEYRSACESLVCFSRSITSARIHLGVAK